MGVTWAIAASSQRERQCVGVLGPAVGAQIRIGAHARRARNHMWVAMRDNRNVSFLKPDRFESGISEERYPTRAAGDNMILDRMLSAGRNLMGNLCRRRSFRD